MAGCSGCCGWGVSVCLLALFWPTHVVEGVGALPLLSAWGTLWGGVVSGPQPWTHGYACALLSDCLRLEIPGCGNPSCCDLTPLVNLETCEGFLARYILLEESLGFYSGCSCGLYGWQKVRPHILEWWVAGYHLLSGWVPLDLPRCFGLNCPAWSVCLGDGGGGCVCVCWVKVLMDQALEDRHWLGHTLFTSMLPLVMQQLCPNPISGVSISPILSPHHHALPHVPPLFSVLWLM